MNRSELIRAVAEKEGMKIADVERVLNSVVTMMEISLACGESVLIRNFGKFEPRDKKATVRRNPKTGETIQVPAKRTVLFHPAPALKQRIKIEGVQP